LAQAQKAVLLEALEPVVADGVVAALVASVHSPAVRA